MIWCDADFCLSDFPANHVKPIERRSRGESPENSNNIAKDWQTNRGNCPKDINKNHPKQKRTTMITKDHQGVDVSLRMDGFLEVSPTNHQNYHCNLLYIILTHTYKQYIPFKKKILLIPMSTKNGPKNFHIWVKVYHQYYGAANISPFLMGIPYPISYFVC